MIQVIEKETTVSKSEKNSIKSCAITGKILMYKLILDYNAIDLDLIIQVVKILIEILPAHRNLEDSIFSIISNLLDNTSKGFYENLSNPKKGQKFYERLLNVLQGSISDKTNLTNNKSLFEFSLIFMLLTYYDKIPSVQIFFPSSIFKQIFNSEESPLEAYLKMILTRPIQHEDANLHFGIFMQMLKNLNNFEYVYTLWNILIDPQCLKELRQISQKNYEFLLYRYSKFILDNFFIVKYVTQIFDNSFFSSMMKFSNAKKIKYVSSLAQSIMKGIDTNQTEAEQTVSAYASDLLNSFGADPENKLSPSTFKHFFDFLFKRLSKENKNDFIERLKALDGEEFEESVFKLTALKQILFSLPQDEEEDMKFSIVEYFLREYYNNQDSDLELEQIIEERLTLVLLSLIRPNMKMINEELVPVKNLNGVKTLQKIHKRIQQLFKKDKLEINAENFKNYMEIHKKVSDSSKNLNEDKENLIKLALMLMIFNLKNPEEYSDVLTDLIQVLEFDENWVKVYTDLTLSILHKGNSKFILS